MNSSTAAYEFIKDAVEAAEGEDALSETVLQDNLYEKIEGEKLIRVGDVQQGNFQLITNSVKEVNAYLTVQILVKCEPDNGAKRIWARNLANEMARAVAGLIIADEKLKDKTGQARVCDAAVTQFSMGFTKPQGTRYAVCYLQLRINSR